MNKEREALALPADTQVGRYRLRRVQATWGFYLTYLAEEIGSSREVFVHELLPEEMVRRGVDGTVQSRTDEEREHLAWARESFVREGRGLAACAHPGVQKIREVIEANSTAYWVTPVEEAHHFKRWLQDLGRTPTEEELRKLLAVLLPALQQVHAAGLHHLNLKPETIQIVADDRPVLVHFAGARQAIAQHSHDASAVTTGYSPIEQYPDGDGRAEGAWTDIYSLAAVLYRAVTGAAPPEATLRLPSDPYEKLAGRFKNQYSADFLAAIDAALVIDPDARPRNVEAWQRMFGISGDNAVKPSVRLNPRPIAAGAAVLAVLLGWGLWHFLSPKPVPPIDDLTKHDEKKVIAKDDKKDEDQKRAEEEKKKEEEAKAEEQRKAEEAKLAEAQKKAEEDRIAAEKAAAEKAAAEKQAEEEAATKAAEAKAAAEKAKTANAAATEATKTAVATRGAAKKLAADKAADEAADARATAEKAAREHAAAEVAAKRAGLEKANAEKSLAEKIAAQKSIEEQLAKIAVEQKAAEEKAASDQAAAEKAAAGKSAAERAAQKISEEKVAAEEMISEKTAAEKAAFEALNAAQTVEKNLAVNTNSSAAEEAKAESEKAAAEKAASEAAARKAAEEKAATDRAAAEKKGTDSSQGQGGGPPPPPPAAGDVGQVGSGLGGVWDTLGPDGKPVKRLIIYPDAYYELITNSSKDSGIIRAKLGKISMDSETTRETVESTFKYKSMGLIETDGALGKAEWVRASANTPERKKDKKE